MNPEMEDKWKYTELGKCKAEISSDQDVHLSLPKANLQIFQSHVSYNNRKPKGTSLLQFSSREWKILKAITGLAWKIWVSYL